MRISIESTTKIVHLNGVPARIWEGKTDLGVPIHCYITRIAVAESAGAEAHMQFEAELEECIQPSKELDAIPLRMIL